MRDFIDMRTLMFISGITSIFLCFCMVYVFRNHKTYAGFRQWTASSLCLAAGMICISQRGILPDLITIVAANLFIVLFTLLINHGLTAFAGMKPRTWLHLSCLALFLAVVIHFTYVRPDLTMRIVLVSGTLAASSAISAMIVYRDIPRVLPTRNWFLIIYFVLNGLWFLLRFLLSMMGNGHPSDLLSAGLYEKLTMLISIEAIIVSTIGLIILNAQRVEHEWTIARDEIKTLEGFLPICASCKKIRDDQGYWNQIESYLHDHADLEFSHSICPECVEKLYPEFSARRRQALP